MRRLTATPLIRIIVTLITLGALMTGARAAAPPTHEFTLDNGLDVLVREDHRAPVAVVMLWYRVGSIDEPPGMTGISHMLEHMLFKDTKHLTPGDYSALVARFGGQSNAFTAYEYTGYYQQYEASRLPLALELEAERMANLRIDPEEFQREIQVVLEERRQRTDDNPNALAWEKFTGILRPGTGYAHPIIGWRREIEQYQPDMAQHWYERWYMPGNATLVIVGDVTLDQVKPQVERFFGQIPARPVPSRPEPRQADIAGERRLNLVLPVQVPTLYMGWNLPSLRTADDPHEFYVLSMLSGVLDGGSSARIERNLVRGQRLAAGAGASYQGLARGDGVFVVSATPNPGVALDDLEAAIEAEIRAIAETPPDQTELDRVRAQVLASHVFGQDSLFGQAMELGYLSMLGVDWRLRANMAEALAAVTPEEVSAAARRYLVAQRRAVAHVQPQVQESKVRASEGGSHDE